MDGFRGVGRAGEDSFGIVGWGDGGRGLGVNYVLRRWQSINFLYSFVNGMLRGNPSAPSPTT